MRAVYMELVGPGLGFDVFFKVLVAGVLLLWSFTGIMFDISIELYLFSSERSLQKHLRHMSIHA